MHPGLQDIKRKRHWGRRAVAPDESHSFIHSFVHADKNTYRVHIRWWRDSTYETDTVPALKGLPVEQGALSPSCSWRKRGCTRSPWGECVCEVTGRVSA